MPGMTDAQTRYEIESVLTEWAWLIDQGKADRASVLFAPDVEQRVGDVITNGIENVAKGLERRAKMSNRTSRHVISNLRLASAPDGNVRATWILTLFRSDDPVKPARPLMINDVQDTFCKGPDGWKIKSREITPIFEN